MVKPEILVYAEWGWTCQECFETVKGYENEQAAKDDSDSHQCDRTLEPPVHNPLFYPDMG